MKSVLDLKEISYRIAVLGQGPKQISEDLRANGIEITRQAVSKFILKNFEKKVVWVPKNNG